MPPIYRAVRYFNDYDRYCGEWLRNIYPNAVVSRADIRRLDGANLVIQGLTRVHLFAGIGGWEYALRLAGWPERRPVWTGIQYLGHNIGKVKNRFTAVV